MSSNNIKLAIVVQGPSIYVEEVKTAWKDFKKDIIFSTWVGSEDLYTNEDRVIFNEIPKVVGAFNFNLQKISSYNGLVEAKRLGYTHAIKVRSDYIPTNAEKFISILDLDKINLLNWHYTCFLWNLYPSLKGYVTDHLIAGPIDHLIELWDIKDNFASAQIMVTWSYIKKLSKKVKLNFLLRDLDQNNDLLYFKKSGSEQYFFFDIELNGKQYKARHESIFQTFMRNPVTNLSQYDLTVDEVERFFNNKYLNFMKYHPTLPKVTIIKNDNLNINFNDIIYPSDKLEIVDTVDNITGEYVINSSDIIDNETIIIEYFKSINQIYDNFNHYFNNYKVFDSAGNFKETGYKKGTETTTSDILLLKNDYLWKPIKTDKNEVNLDFIIISSTSILEDMIGQGIVINSFKDESTNELNNKVLRLNKVISGENLINHQVNIKNSWIDIIGIEYLLKKYNIKKVKYLEIDYSHEEILKGLFNYITSLDQEHHPKIIKLIDFSIKNMGENTLDIIEKMEYDIATGRDCVLSKKA